MAAQITLVRFPAVLVLRLRLALGDRAVAISMEPQAGAGALEVRLPVIREVLGVMAVRVKNTLRLGQGPVLALREGPCLV